MNGSVYAHADKNAAIGLLYGFNDDLLYIWKKT